MIPTGSKTAATPKAKPVVAKVVKKVTERPLYLAIFRQTKADPWAHKGFGQQFFRDIELAERAVPPNATEAHIIEIVLPL